MTVVQTPSMTREHRGSSIPAAGTYAIDQAHSEVEFVARHMMVSKVRGRFDDFSGTITIGEVPEDSHVEVTVSAASVSTKEAKRDEHLRSGDFFDVENHPTWTFRSTAVEAAGDGGWKVTGDLTIRDITKPVVLDVEFEGASKSPWGTTAIGFSATTSIERDDWGVSFNQALETGGFLVGKRVVIELSVEANPVA